MVCITVPVHLTVLPGSTSVQMFNISSVSPVAVFTVSLLIERHIIVIFNAVLQCWCIRACHTIRACRYMVSTVCGVVLRSSLCGQ